MRPHSRVLAVLLLAAFVAAASGTPLLALPAMHSSHSSGCHGSMPENPSPAPANYQCCVSGHNWAMPSAAFSSLPLIGTPVDIQGVDPASECGESAALFFSPSVSPPAVVALRI